MSKQTTTDLREELNKPAYDLTTFQVDQILSLVSELVEECVGEDEEAGCWSERTVEIRNVVRAEIRQRFNEALGE